MEIIDRHCFRRLFATFLVCLLAHNPMAQAADSDDPDSPQAKLMESAREAIDQQDYPQAIAHLKKVMADDAQNADALNLMGYSHRKSGQLDQAFNYYQKALAIDPEHRGANEYLGELYLQRDQLDKAEQRLAVLDEACFLPCNEYTDIKEAIAGYRKRKGLN